MSEFDANRALSASLEDYLEAIYEIVQVKQAARAKDIGQRLQVSRSSVTGAMHALAERDLINYAPYDIVTLTAKGQAAAENVVRRHEVLRGFFVRVLSVDASEADAAACKMEHAIPEVILDRFVKFVDFLEVSPRDGLKLTDAFARYCDLNQESREPRSAPLPVSENESQTGMTTVTELDSPPASATLASLKPGQAAKVIKIEGVGGIRRRLLDMGVTAGTRVEVERIAPLGDPIEIKIKGYHLTLRKEEARRILVEGA